MVNGVALDTYFASTPVAIDGIMKAFRVIELKVILFFCNS
jgi:hypothetical protein